MAQLLELKAPRDVSFHIEMSTKKVVEGGGAICQCFLGQKYEGWMAPWGS